MSSYFKRMSQLARSGAPRRRLPDRTTLSSLALNEVSVEVPVPKAQTAPPAPRPNLASFAQTSPALHAERPLQQPSSPPSVKGPTDRQTAVQRLAQPMPDQPAPAESLGQVFSPRARPGVPEAVRSRVEPSVEAAPLSTEQKIIGDVSPAAALAPNSGRVGSTEDRAQVSGPPEREVLTHTMPRTDSRAIEKPPLARDDLTFEREAPKPAPEDASPTPSPPLPLLLSPEPSGPERAVIPAAVSGDKPMPPTLTAPASRPDVEVSIGTVNLSLDPEPIAPVPPAPPPTPAARPRAGGIWTDGRSFTRSYLRRL